MRHRAPVVLIALALVLLIGWYIAYTRRVVLELRSAAGRTGLMFAHVYRALGDTSEATHTDALLQLSRQIREMGVPVIVTDAAGRVAAAANLPGGEVPTGERLEALIAELNASNPPVIEPGVGTIHYGDPPLVETVQLIPILQAFALLAVIGAAAYALRLRGRAERERVWAGMAREAAHQLATPLSSLAGWVELIEDGAGSPVPASVSTHMRADLERLERVAHRFERIGRPPRRDPVDVGELLEKIAAYFRARVPTLAHPVTITVTRPSEPLVVQADAVLLEWALEALAKNAVDALAGRPGRIAFAAERLDDGAVRLRVADDGPGVPRELRRRIFEAGFTTKDRGWGIGLSLARRIVRDAHGGRLVLVPTDRGATFDVILR